MRSLASMFLLSVVIGLSGCGQEKKSSGAGPQVDARPPAEAVVEGPVIDDSEFLELLAQVKASHEKLASPIGTPVKAKYVGSIFVSDIGDERRAPRMNTGGYALNAEAIAGFNLEIADEKIQKMLREDLHEWTGAEIEGTILRHPESVDGTSKPGTMRVDALRLMIKEDGKNRRVISDAPYFYQIQFNANVPTERATEAFKETVNYVWQELQKDSNGFRENNQSHFSFNRGTLNWSRGFSSPYALSELQKKLDEFPEMKPYMKIKATY